MKVSLSLSFTLKTAVKADENGLDVQKQAGF
jgi:hypothetical protein